MYKGILFLVALMVAVYYFFVPASSPSKDTLLVGTNAEYAPYCFMDKGEIVGFDIDVAKEIAQRLQKEIVFSDMPFESLIPSLCLGKLDFVAAGLSKTEERAKNVLFSNPYLEGDSFVILSHKEVDVKTVSDLLNKKVAVNEGYTADLYVSELFEGKIHTIRFPSTTDAFMALSCKKVDVFVTASSTVKRFLTQHPNHDYQILYLQETSDSVSLGFPKNKKQQLFQVQEILNAMESDGTLLKFKEKWGLL